MTFTALVFTDCYSIQFCQHLPELTQIGENKGKISLRPLSTVRLSLHRFSRNSLLLNGIMWLSDFTPIG